MMSFTPFVLLVCLVGLAAAGIPEDTGTEVVEDNSEVVEESSEAVDKNPKHNPKLKAAIKGVHDARIKLIEDLNKLHEEGGGTLTDLLPNNDGILKGFMTLEDKLVDVDDTLLEEDEEEPICDHLVEAVHKEEEIDSAVKDDIDCFVRQAGHLSKKIDKLFNGDEDDEEEEEVKHIDIVLLNDRLRGLIGDFNAMIRALPKPKEGDRPGPEADQQGQPEDTGPLEKRLLELLLEKRLKKTDKPSHKRSFHGY